MYTGAPRSVLLLERLRVARELRALQQQRPARFLQRREQRKALALFRLQQERVVKQ
jgi:hypothetical protein